jgi:hypothetical protein
MRDGDTPSLPAGYHLDLISDPVASYPPNILPHQARSVASSRSAVPSVGVRVGQGYRAILAALVILGLLLPGCTLTRTSRAPKVCASGSAPWSWQTASTLLRPTRTWATTR